MRDSPISFGNRVGENRGHLILVMPISVKEKKTDYLE